MSQKALQGQVRLPKSAGSFLPQNKKYMLKYSFCRREKVFLCENLTRKEKNYGNS